MTEYLFELPRHSKGTLQSRIQEMIVSAILGEHLVPDTPLPSSRKLARQLSVARNTVVQAYQHLVDEGFLVARERSGFYINTEILKGRVAVLRKPRSPASKIDWSSRLSVDAVAFRQNVKPANWYQFPYPFICGQYDRKIFPVADWRECAREALTVNAIHDWAKDHIDQDNPELIDQIHKKILPRRGVWAEQDEILITVGAQQGLYLTAQLLLDQSRTVGYENPGYVDAQNTFMLFTRRCRALQVDRQGLLPDDRFAACDCAYTTPSHHYPTTVTMPRQRRDELLEQAHKHDVIIIEDDYESEFNYVDNPTPALKSLDRDGRVIYIGSLSKTLAPGIRLGYLVAPADFIRQARALRRLILRHPPSNNQFIIAEFLKRGYHDSLINRLSQSLKERWSLLGKLLDHRIPGASVSLPFGGSAFWVEAPRELDAKALLNRTARQGVLFEPGEVFFSDRDKPKHFFRLGFSSISTDKIEPGLDRIMESMKK